MFYEYCQSFRDVPNMRILADNAIGNNVVQLSFVDLDELFRKIIHQTRLFLWLQRMSFLNT